MLERLLNFLSRVFSRMPLDRALAWGRRLGRFVYAVLRLKRDEAEKNLAFCLPDTSPEERKRILRGMYENLGMNFVEMLRVAELGMEDLLNHLSFTFTPEELDQMDPRLYLMGHIGNWEALGVMTRQNRTSIHVVVKNMKNQESQDFLVRVRNSLEMKLLPAKNSFRACLQAIKKGDIVAIILDQNMRNEYGIFVDFFGKSACTSAGLAVISASTNKPAYFLNCIRKPDYSLEVSLEGPIPPPASRSPEDLHKATQLYTKLIEDKIRAYPEQWIWMHRRWRTRPSENSNDWKPQESA